MRRPVTSLVLAVAVLGAASPRCTSPSTWARPASRPCPPPWRPARASRSCRTDFPGASMQPVEVTIAGDADSPAVAQGIDRAAHHPGRRPGVRGRRRHARRAPTANSPCSRWSSWASPNGGAAQAAVRTLRADYLPAAFAGTGLVAGTDVLTTGQTSFVIDYLDTINGATALGLPLRARTVVRAPAGGVPLARGAAQSHPHEPALGGGRLRPHGGGVPEGMGSGPSWTPESGLRRGLGAPLPVRGALRHLHGLPRVPAQPHPRALRPDRRQPGVGGVRRCAGPAGSSPARP